MQPSGTLTRMFEDLKSKDKAVRNHAGKELGNFVSYMLSELKGERLQLFTNELNRRVIELSHSTLSASKLGGITAIDHFIGLESEDNSARLYRFYQYLKPNLPCSDPQVMMAAARVLGRVSKHGGHSLGDQFVEFEVHFLLLRTMAPFDGNILHKGTHTDHLQ